MKRYFCLLLCVCLLFTFSNSFAINAKAISPELILASSAAGLFSLVSSLMSVNFTFSGLDLSSFSDFWTSDPLTEIGRFWVSDITGGMVNIRGELPSLRNLVNNAAQKITDLAISDNSSGDVVISYGSYFGVPLTSSESGIYKTQSITYSDSNPSTFGDLTVSFQRYSNTQYYYINFQSAEGINVRSQYSMHFPMTVYFSVRSNNVYYHISSTSGDPLTQSKVFTTSREGIEISESSASYVSGVIDTGIADTVPPTGGIQISMPYTGQPDISSILDSLNQLILDGDTSSINAEILDDVGTPVDTEQTISVTPWTALNTWLSTISSTLTGIRTGIHTLVNSISNVGETILEAVETGPIQLFQSVLGLVQSSFASVFERIRSGLGIWRYVVSWFNTIISPFTFLSSVLPSGIWLPVYASVAGSLVIAIFRRFGR